MCRVVKMSSGCVRHNRSFFICEEYQIFHLFVDAVHSGCIILHNIFTTQTIQTFENHLSHLVIHGLLHLLGYLHDEEKDALIMENIEVDILEGIGISNPYEGIR